MSASYLLLKENKQEAVLSKSASNNQTILIEDTNASSALSALQTIEWSINDVLILTLILFSINVSFKFIEKLLDYLRKKIHTLRSKTDTDCNETKENKSSSTITHSSCESSKDSQ